MYVSDSWAGSRLRSGVRLGLGSSLAAVALVGHLADPDAGTLQVYNAIGAVLWLALAGVVAFTLVQGRFGRAWWWESLASILLLVATLIAQFSILGDLSGDVAVVGYIIFYLIELRGVVQSSPAWYAALAIAGVTVVASLAMADVEAATPEGQISNGGEALLWAAAQVLRFGGLVQQRPVTSTGEFFGFIVILAAVLFSAVMLSSITAWAVRQSTNKRESDDERVRRQVRAVLVEAGVISEPEETEWEDVPRLYIDVDDVVGRQPRHWLRSRRAVTEEFLRELSGSQTLAQLRREVPPDTRVVAVLKSSVEVDAHDVELDDAIVVHVVEHHSVSDWINDHARLGDRVVTGQARLVKELTEREVEVLSPTWPASDDDARKRP